MPTSIRVLTLNILNMADRWPERLPLLLAEFGALQPDVAGLQEVVYVMQQDRLLAASGEGEYAVRRAWAYRPDEAGNSLLVRRPLADRLTPPSGDERLDLGLQPERRPGRADAGRRPPSAPRQHPPASHDRGRARAAPRCPGPRPARLAGRAAAGGRHGRDGRLQRRPARADLRGDGRRRLPIRLSRGERCRAGS